MSVVSDRPPHTRAGALATMRRVCVLAALVYAFVPLLLGGIYVNTPSAFDSDRDSTWSSICDAPLPNILIAYTTVYAVVTVTAFVHSVSSMWRRAVKVKEVYILAVEIIVIGAALTALSIWGTVALATSVTCADKDRGTFILTSFFVAWGYVACLVLCCFVCLLFGMGFYSNPPVPTHINHSVT